LKRGDTAKEEIAKTFKMSVPALFVTTLVLVASFADLVFLPALLLAVGEKFFLAKY
jgi:hypothetical protein